MTVRMRTTALAVTGAVIAATGAYALGTQAGGGDASANGQVRIAQARAKMRMGVFGGRRGPMLEDVAAQVGVKPADLQAALDAVLKSQPRSHDELATALAGVLGMPVAKVQDALDKQDRIARPMHGLHGF